MYSASAESVLGIANFTSSYIEPGFLKLKDKLFKPSQQTLDKRVASYTNSYLFGFKGSLKVIKDALKKGASPNVQRDRLDSEWRKIGTEPVLITAARFNAQELVEVLLIAGADINAKDSDGKNAADATQRGGLRGMNALLTEKGAQATTTPEAPSRFPTLAQAANDFKESAELRDAVPKAPAPAPKPGPAQRFC
ncbi:MAG: hypothetical protein K0R10_672 [Alphaproteobacteria bacterium]|jgi:hypothetical protein|nr:hypothetical protein [Alphaproteobacteria bacterium]